MQYVGAALRDSWGPQAVPTLCAAAVLCGDTAGPRAVGCAGPVARLLFSRLVTVDGSL